MSSYTLEDLLYLMARLRDPNSGCPWDIDQDFVSIASHTVEESYELVDAIHKQDYQQIKEELGDVLFQVVFYAQLGKEQSHFDFTDIFSGLIDKLIRRHPHVFPDGTLTSENDGEPPSTDSIKKNWEAIKRSEREKKTQFGVLDDVPIALPALSRAIKLQKRASQTGFDWDGVDGALDHLYSEIEELKEARGLGDQENIQSELGDLLFCVVNVARHLKVEPESALQGTNRKFEKRFRYIEQKLSQQGSSPAEASTELMDTLWDEAKALGL
jgi:ATP diphosphatase